MGAPVIRLGHALGSGGVGHATVPLVVRSPHVHVQGLVANMPLGGAMHLCAQVKAL